MLDKVYKINKNTPIPLYYQLKELIKSEIKDGTYKSGDVIPTEKEISEAFQISRTTVRQAITEMVQEGLLYRIKSKGTFVARPKVSQEYARKIESFNKQIVRLGMTPSTEVLEFRVLKHDEIQDAVKSALNLKDSDNVIYLHRKRMADGAPIVTVKTYLPYEECRKILNHNMITESMYDVLSDDDETNIYRIDRVIEAIEANSEDVKYLNMRRGKPIQYFISVGYNVYGKPIEYSLSRYRGDSNKFEITVFPETKKNV